MLSMLAIIAHHSVVNSSVIEHVGDTFMTGEWFLLLWGAWGKVAINSFVLISGYFLCTGRLTLRKWVKLYLEIQFYRFVIMTLFAITGYEMPSVSHIVRGLLFPFPDVNNGFGSSFMVFYAGVPLYNKVLDGLSQRRHLLMLCVLLGMFTFSSTFFGSGTFSGGTMNEPFWYMTLYFIAAYIRLHPNSLTEGLWINAVALIMSLALAIGSMVALEIRTGSFVGAYFLVIDSNKLLALAVGLFAFLTFKNMPRFHSATINSLASGCFGVLLIHASSDTMRRWLWQDIVGVPTLYESGDMVRMVWMLLAVPVVIYVICALLDLVRQRWIEAPVMSMLAKYI